MRSRVPSVLITFALLSPGCSSSSPNGSSGFFEGDGVAVATDDSHPNLFVVADGVIYFSELDSASGGSIKAVPIAGGAVTTLSQTAEVPRALISDGSSVWWLEKSGDTGVIMSVTVSGSSASAQVASGLSDPATALALDAGYLYYVEKTSGAIWRVPVTGGEPTQWATGAEGVIVALAADNEYLYFAEAFDAPNGAIKRLRTADEFPVAEDVVTGLGAPFALALYGTDICWRELQGGHVSCAPKEGGAVTQLATDQSFLPLGGTVIVVDDNAVYFVSGTEVRRVSRGGGSVELVARAAELSSGVKAIALVGADLFWSDGLRLREVAKTNTVVPDGGGTDGGGPSVGCPSVYDGTYVGQFVYEWDSGDPSNPPLQTVTDSVTVSVELSCLATAAGSTVLTITHASASNAYFGCQLAGCTPQFGSTATLPAEVPTTVTNVSQSGQGLVILFPNGSSLGTTNSTGALTVTGEALTVRNSLDPAIQDSTWVATGPQASFPPERQEGTPVTRYKSWVLNKSAQ